MEDFISASPIPGHGLLICTAKPSHSTPSSSQQTTQSYTTQITRSFGSYPLKLLSPPTNYSQSQVQAALVFLLSYGGGLVSGDHIHVDVICKENARLVLTTQGFTKIFKHRRYRVNVDTCSNGSYDTNVDTTIPKNQRISVDTVGVTKSTIKVSLSRNSFLFLLPEPISLFRDSKYHQRQEFRVHLDSNLVVLDWFTSGRECYGDEVYLFDEFRSRNDVVLVNEEGEVMMDDTIDDLFVTKNRRNEKMVVRDVVYISNPSKSSAQNTVNSNTPIPSHPLEPYKIYCTIIIYGSELSPLIQHFINLYASVPRVQQSKFRSYRNESTSRPLTFSVSNVKYKDETGKHGIIVRAAAIKTEMLRDWVKENLKMVAEWTGVNVFERQL
ncbi:UreD urease accessory protein-domain-containing protein [Paraphysoderma sedebokerense]|nr:UreD urease accessory protein-domain-containing protein [Paraphysoderma sedebokerense]